MGTVKLCVHELAKTPYYAEATGIHLYSIEELAYYLYENIYLIDERMIDEKLYSWIEMELGLWKLAERLRNGRGSGNHIYNQVMVILQASEYYSERELGELSEKIKTISGMQAQERMKYKADDLMQNENYWAAIAEYERILGIRQSSRLSVEFYAKVWNNLAGCYARLFLFQEAIHCYDKAYALNGNPASQEAIQMAGRCLNREISAQNAEFVDKLESIALMNNREQRSQYHKAVSDIIFNWKEEYRRICRI